MKIEKTTYQQLRGMEPVYTTSTDSVIFRYHKLSDLTYFFIDIRYLKEWPLNRLLGAWRWLYMPIHYPEYQGMFFYLFPIALFIHFKRWCWMMWTYPLRLLVDHHLARKKDRGAILGVLWWRDVEFGRMVHTKE